VRLYRFGPYEFDLERNELRKFGLRIRVERKPLQLLFILLDHAGEIVTRSELRQLLWGEGVFVDFDKGLNVAVNKLRAALNDFSDAPRYIETIAGEGYRLTVNVERLSASDLVSGSELNAKGKNRFLDALLSWSLSRPLL
jgi:DNA-binding winged helix-turn-helix (wHTH) protein